MNANEYNKIRRILFCTINDPSKGFNIAYEWLEKTYKDKLGPTSYTGLKAELNFYEKHRKEFKLTVAGDMGEHADFSGVYENDAVRFDVTTNINYKEFSSYEPFLGDGIEYKIALLGSKNFEVIDVMSLAFESCECGGYLLPFILLLGENFNKHGESQWSNDQLMMKVCSNCQCFNETERHTHHFLFSPSEFSADLPDEMPISKKIDKTQEYCLDSYKYFRRNINDNLMGVAEPYYKITSQNGGGLWVFNFHFKNKVVASLIDKEFECGLIV